VSDGENAFQKVTGCSEKKPFDEEKHREASRRKYLNSIRSGQK